MTYDEAVANNVKWRDMYLSLLASWTALCDMAGVEGDSSPDEVRAALAADPPALDVEAIVKQVVADVIEADHDEDRMVDAEAIGNIVWENLRPYARLTREETPHE